MLERQHRKAVRENADDNRGDTVHQISRVTHDESRRGAAELSKVDGAKEADRDADQNGEQKQLGAADYSVRHAATGFPHGSRKPGKEAPTYGRSPVDD